MPQSAGGCCPHAVSLQRRRPQTEADRLADRASHLYQCERLSARKIAEVLGIGRHRVVRLLRRAGITVAPRGAGRSRPPDARAAVAEDLYLRHRLSSTQIAALIGVPSRTVRDWLAARAVPMRTTGRMNREDRLAVPPEPLIEVYVRAGLPATRAAVLLGVPARVVLRTAHDLGLPVRLGGPPPEHGTAEIELIDALYADDAVSRVLTRHGIAQIPPGGAIWERFPDRIPLRPGLAAELYVGCGLGLRHIELLSGIPAETIRRMLRGQGVGLRAAGGRSPFLRRWRSGGGPAEPAAAASNGGPEPADVDPGPRRQAVI